jgi:hypothetical protein
MKIKRYIKEKKIASKNNLSIISDGEISSGKHILIIFDKRRLKISKIAETN